MPSDQDDGDDDDDDNDDGDDDYVTWPVHMPSDQEWGSFAPSAFTQDRRLHEEQIHEDGDISWIMIHYALEKDFCVHENQDHDEVYKRSVPMVDQLTLSVPYRLSNVHFLQLQGRFD